MDRTIIFEGKVTLANQLVDFRIYKNTGVDIIDHYSFEINPEVRDASQADFHRGEIQRAETIEKLFSRFKMFQLEFTNIVEQRENTEF